LCWKEELFSIKDLLGWKPCSNGHFAGPSPKYTVRSLALWSCQSLSKMRIYWSHYKEECNKEQKNVHSEKKIEDWIAGELTTVEKRFFKYSTLAWDLVTTLLMSEEKCIFFSLDHTT
jgi:hypothetical protein